MAQATLDELRTMWDRAVERDKPAEAVVALIELERREHGEPRWSQRLGEAYRRLHKMHEAEEAFTRAMDRYVEKGFMPRAIAMAKLVEAINPAKKDLLARLDPKPAPPPLPTKLPPPLPLAPIPLERAPDAAVDEVRFVDVPGRSSIEIVLEDISEISLVPSSVIEVSSRDVLVTDSLADRAIAEPQDLAATLDRPVKSPLSNLPVPQEPSIDRLATMAAFRFFAGMSRDALVALSAEADLVEFVPGAMVFVRDEPAFALYVIVDGAARVIVKNSPEIRVGEGDVIGEACLLDEGTRQADVRAETPLMVLRVKKATLDAVTKTHADVSSALFLLLARRLITNLMNTSPLFTVFEPRVRLELAQMFEVRRAEPGTILADRGRRSDGLYVLLAGHVMAKGESAKEIQVARGTAFGHASLLGGALAQETVRVATESVVLRLPAAAFASLAATYPPALAMLAESANDPLPASRILE